DRVMDSIRLLIQRILDYFCALNGTVDFFIDHNSKRLQWSRILCIYRIVHNFLVITFTAKFILDFRVIVLADMMKSTLLTLNYVTYFTLVYVTVISCMDCSYRRQNRIYIIKQTLLHLKMSSKNKDCFAPKDKQQSLDYLLYVLALLLALRLSIHVALNVLRERMGFNHPCNCFLSEGMIFAMNTLVFGILSDICQCWWRTLSQFGKLISGRKNISHAKKIQQIRQLQVRFQCLIDLTAEVSCIFKYVFLCYLARNLWSGIVVGYLIVRMCLGQGSGDNEFMYILLAFVTCIQPLMYSLLMNCIFHTTDSLLGSVRDTLRQSNANEDRAGRRVGIMVYIAETNYEWNDFQMEWFSMQLARQHTFITVYGTFRINRSLAFRSSAVILIHVLYMVQADYTVMFK
ncbi:hypothetical protein KR018_002635, partial [Drosophila ironensis]